MKAGIKNCLFIGLSVLVLACRSGDKPLYLDETAPLEDRVEDIVSRLTLKEKISQLRYDAPAVKNKRVNIPAYNWWNECLHGVARAGEATVYPQAIALAATFDTDLLQRIAGQIADEARAKYELFQRLGRQGRMNEGLTFWSPNINIFRDPRWGRGQETYGEDPYLTGKMAAAFVKGLQGNHPHYFKVIATAKHFAVHSGPEHLRHRLDVYPTEYDLRETYLPAFRMAVQEAGVQSVMCAYNRFRGKPCCGSDSLLRDILIRDFGFDGYVVSDCWAITDFYEKESHHVAKSRAQAAAMALKAGTDLNCGVTYRYLQAALDSGYISEKNIDASLRKLFRARFRLGMFDDPKNVPFAGIPYSVVCSPKHGRTALEAARKSIVLLKNENRLLPLKKSIKSLAVVGPFANDIDVMLGNYNGYPRKRDTFLEAFKRKLPGVKIRYAAGSFLCDGFPPVQYIPARYLLSGPNDTPGGLNGAYFNNDSCAGRAVMTRTDSLLNFNWYRGSPLNGAVADTFSVRWRGKILAPVTGVYKIAVKTRDKFTLQIGDSVVVSDNPWDYNRRFDFYMKKGKAYPIDITYANYGSRGQMHLMWYIPNPRLLREAIDQIKQSDAAVLFMGLSTLLEEEEMDLKLEGFDRGDRTLLRLPRAQRTLIRRAAATGKPVVLVLTGGSALAVSWAKQNVPAILFVWYPGQRGGDALADIIFGDYNPSGRLPVTFYKSVKDLPPFDDYNMRNRTYKYFTGEPLYEFGYGLSYTKFVYDNLKADRNEFGTKDTINFNLRISNVGCCEGDEIVQVYARNFNSGLSRPKKELIRFNRLSLKRNEQKEWSFSLPVSALSLWDDEKKMFLVNPGEYELLVGASSEDIRCKVKFKITD